MAARGEITVNGFDLGELGFVLQDETRGWRDGYAVGTTETVPVPGSGGVAVLGRTAEARRLTVRGSVKATTRAEMLTAFDELKARLADGVLEVSIGDDTTRVFFCELDGAVEVEPVPPVLTQTIQRVSFTLLCPAAVAFDAYPTIVDFSSAAAEVPLGTGPVAPLIKLYGPTTNPVVVTYKDAWGTTKASMGLAVALGAADVREIDCARFRIVDGAGVNRIGELSTGDFFSMDPRDALDESGPFPTLSVTGLTGNALAHYRRTWL